jgi:hypothetical protein
MYMIPLVKSNAVVILAILTALRLVHPASAEPVPISSALQMKAIAVVDDNTTMDRDRQSQGATLNPLSVSVEAVAQTVGAYVRTTGNGRASWISPSQGTVQFTEVGWNTANVERGVADLSQGLDWRYTFIADRTGTFRMGYEIRSYGSDTFGLNGYTFFWSGPEGGADLPVDTAGAIDRSIAVGETYTVGLVNRAAISGGLDTRDADMKSLFQWSMNIRSNPEPSSLILLGLGALGLLGYAWRRMA